MTNSTIAGVCTVIIDVPASPNRATRLLALRDEDPSRPWDPLGAWWPDAPEVIGVRDRQAGGAWLAVNRSMQRLAVILNRGEPVDSAGVPLQSRGGISLAAATDALGAERPHTAAFNLVQASATQASVTTWNGSDFTTRAIEPGVHMIAHTNLDDENSPRIAAWLDEFRVSATNTDHAGGGSWRDAWVTTLTRTTSLEATDDRAIVRDNRPLGIPTLTLYAVMAEISHDGVKLWHAILKEPADWRGARFEVVV